MEANDEMVESHDVSEIAKFVQEEVNTFWKSSLRGIFSDYMAQKRVQQAQEVHTGYICDGCDAHPIKGIRYMCSVRGNFDLCEACERKGIHN